MPILEAGLNDLVAESSWPRRCEITGSSVEPVFEPLPVDDPQRRRPDIGLAQRVLGWSR